MNSAGASRWNLLVLASPVLLAVVSALVPLVAPPAEEPDEDFYMAAAQVIPVILLAMIVETRLTDVWRTPDGRPWGQIVIAGLLVAEAAALLEAADIFGVMASLSVTAAGLMGGFAAVALAAVVPTGWLASPSPPPPSGDAGP
jgi:hypothetical protein